MLNLTSIKLKLPSSMISLGKFISLWSVPLTSFLKHSSLTSTALKTEINKSSLSPTQEIHIYNVSPANAHARQ